MRSYVSWVKKKFALFVGVSNIPFVLCIFFYINYLGTVLALKNMFLDEKYVDKNKGEIYGHVSIFYTMWTSFF